MNQLSWFPIIVRKLGVEFGGLALIAISVLILVFSRHLISKPIEHSKDEQKRLSKLLEHKNLELTNPKNAPNTTGVIQTIHGDIIEYTYQKDKKYYTAFKRVANPYYYKVGDKITI